MMKRTNKIVYIISVFVVIFAIILSIVFILFDDNMRNIINNYSESVGKACVNTILNDNVYSYLEDNDVQYNELVDITYDENRNVKSIVIDSIKVNKIKSGIVLAIQNEIINNGKFSIGIPVGTVIGSSFLLNRGPTIPINMVMSSAVQSNVVSSFEGSGINQTLHRLTLNIDMDIYMVMPWYRSNSNFATDFIIAETIIVGDIPDAFTVVIESEDDNTGGLINDYGANNYN